MRESISTSDVTQCNVLCVIIIFVVSVSAHCNPVNVFFVDRGRKATTLAFSDEKILHKKKNVPTKIAAAVCVRVCDAC